MDSVFLSSLASTDISLRKSPPDDIVLPFYLRTDPDAFKDASNRAMLFKLFPGVDQISFNGFYVKFLFKSLPPKLGHVKWQECSHI